MRKAETKAMMPMTARREAGVGAFDKEGVGEKFDVDGHAFCGSEVRSGENKDGRIFGVGDEILADGAAGGGVGAGDAVDTDVAREVVGVLAFASVVESGG